MYKRNVHIIKNTSDVVVNAMRLGDFWIANDIFFLQINPVRNSKGNNPLHQRNKLTTFSFVLSIFEKEFTPASRVYVI